MNNKQLTEKVALVTGASRGIGKSIAIALAGAGASVIVNYHNNKDSAIEVVKEITESGGKAIAVQADVANAESVIDLFNLAKTHFGVVDILVNNAAIDQVKKSEELTIEDWNETLQTNLTSCFLTIQAALPYMKEKKYGRIINISSTAAQTGGVIGPHYTASKAGIIGLTHSYASLLAADGITVNAIAPALIETDMIYNNPNIKPDLLPVKRFGKPDEVAMVALMLACNGYITGQTLNVNGGLYMG